MVCSIKQCSLNLQQKPLTLSHVHSLFPVLLLWCSDNGVQHQAVLIKLAAEAPHFVPPPLLVPHPVPVLLKQRRAASSSAHEMCSRNPVTLSRIHSCAALTRVYSIAMPRLVSICSSMRLCRAATSWLLRPWTLQQGTKA